MKKIFNILAIASVAFFAASCDLSEFTIDDVGVGATFGSEANIEMLVNNFYDELPKVTSVYSSDTGDDYIAVKEVGGKYAKSYTAAADGSKLDGFDKLRNFNYFIEKVNSAACPFEQDKKDSYIAIARYFRADWYFGKVKSLGDIQWYDHVVLTTDFDDQYKNRDPRKTVVANIIQDLDFAFEHMTNESVDKTTPDKWCAMFLKMRVCLFEGSWQKYHVGDETAAKDYFTLAAAAARTIMDSKQFSLHGNYRELFTSEALCQDEVLLGAATGEDGPDKVRGSQNNYFNYFSGTERSAIRPFVNIYLNADGTRFTATNAYKTMVFNNEFTGRDPRLTMTFRHPAYKFDGTLAKGVPNFSLCPLGYQAIKWIIDAPLDDTKDDQHSNLNTNSVPAFRYAEVLLSYAEAQAEMGLDTDWANTVGALRKRAGLTNTAAPGKADIDTYLKENFYPDLNDATLLEIRRERMVEFAFEGLRSNDLKRWNCSDRVVKADWSGMYVPELDKPMDLNGDEIADVYFSKSPVDAGSPYKDIWQQIDKESYGLSARQEGTGWGLVFKANPDNRFWDDNHRDLAPIHTDIINEYELRGYKLSQNPGY